MTDPLPGVQRAAVLVVALGVETAAALLPALTDDEVERVSIEVARLERVPGDAVDAVLRAYRDAAGVAPTPDAAGGLDAARALVRESGEGRAEAILPRVEAATEGTGFALAEAAPPAELAAFLAGEHPQTAAVVLSRLPARPAADVLGALPAETRGDVVRRLSLLDPPTDAALRDLDAALRRRFGGGALAGPSGAKRAADVLTQSGRETGRSVLDALQASAPDLAAQIEDLLFVFDDLVRLDGRHLARVLAEADTSTLALALRACEEPLKDKVFANVSERVGAALREEIEMGGAAQVADVEDAQRTVVGVALALAENGDISLEPAPEPVAA